MSGIPEGKKRVPVTFSAETIEAIDFVANTLGYSRAGLIQALTCEFLNDRGLGFAAKDTDGSFEYRLDENPIYPDDVMSFKFESWKLLKRLGSTRHPDFEDEYDKLLNDYGFSRVEKNNKKKKK